MKGHERSHEVRLTKFFVAHSFISRFWWTFINIFNCLEKGETRETKTERNRGKVSELKTTPNNFDKKQGKYLESTTTSEELVGSKDSNGAKEADSTTGNT